jgi:hypothetical protein
VRERQWAGQQLTKNVAWLYVAWLYAMLKQGASNPRNPSAACMLSGAGAPLDLACPTRRSSRVPRTRRLP